MSALWCTNQASEYRGWMMKRTWATLRHFAGINMASFLRRVCAMGHDPVRGGVYGGLEAVGQIQFGVDAFKSSADRSFAHMQASGQLAIRLTSGNSLQDLPFQTIERVRIGPPFTGERDCGWCHNVTARHKAHHVS